MTHKTHSVRHLLVTLMVLIGFFAANVGVANAQLANIISSGIGAATSAAISCNKNAISKGISSIFGGGATGSVSSNAAANLASLKNAGPMGPSSLSTDGPLDLIGPKLLPTNTTPVSPGAITDPAAFPGLSLGTSPTVASAGGLPGLGGGTSLVNGQIPTTGTSGIPGLGGGTPLVNGDIPSSSSATSNIFGLTGVSSVPVTNSTLEVC